MSRLCLETSALLRMLLQEEGAEEVADRLRGAERVVASRLIQVEAERALVRLRLDRPERARVIPELHRDLRNLWTHVDFLEITRAICDLAGRIAPASKLRTLDAIHLATFERVRELDPTVEMLSHDERILAEV